MNNFVEIEGHKATKSFDRETGLFRGEFTGLNGGADFYASSPEQLIIEGRKSLNVFLQLCAENGIEPLKSHDVRLDALRRDIAEGHASGESEPLDMAAIKLEVRNTGNF